VKHIAKQRNVFSTLKVWKTKFTKFFFLLMPGNVGNNVAVDSARISSRHGIIFLKVSLFSFE